MNALPKYVLAEKNNLLFIFYKHISVIKMFSTVLY